MFINFFKLLANVRQFDSGFSWKQNVCNNPAYV